MSNTYDKQYRLHNDVVAVMADAFFQKQIHPAKTIYLLNDIPDHTNDDDWDLIKKLIRYHPRLSAAISNIKDSSDYIGGNQGVWSDFILNNSDGDPTDPMQMMRMLTMGGSGRQYHHIASGELNHMSHLWQEIKVEIQQTINYQILKITI